MTNWFHKETVEVQEYRVPIALNTEADWAEFLKIATAAPFDVDIADSRTGKINRVSAKSMLGLIYAQTGFRHLYCITPEPFSDKILKFIREDDKDLDI